MPVAKKTLRTSKTRSLISVSREIALDVLAYARHKDPEATFIKNTTAKADGYVNLVDTKWYKKMKASWHPGKTLRARRQNAGMTQAQLAQATGLAISNISAMKNGKRPIGIAVARKLAAALGRPVSEFVDPSE